MSDRIMKQLLQRHEFIKVGIPFRWVIHAPFPLIIFRGIDFFQKRKIGAVIDFSYSLMCKDLSLSSRAEGVEPVEKTCKKI